MAANAHVHARGSSVNRIRGYASIRLRSLRSPLIAHPSCRNSYRVTLFCCIYPLYNGPRYCRPPDKPPYTPRVSPETLSLVSRCLSQGAFGDGITIPEHSGHVSADLGVRPQATPGASIPHSAALCSLSHKSIVVFPTHSNPPITCRGRHEAPKLHPATVQKMTWYCFFHASPIARCFFQP